MFDDSVNPFAGKALFHPPFLESVMTNAHNVTAPVLDNASTEISVPAEIDYDLFLLKLVE